MPSGEDEGWPVLRLSTVDEKPLQPVAERKESIARFIVDSEEAGRRRQFARRDSE